MCTPDVETPEAPPPPPPAPPAPQKTATSVKSKGKTRGDKSRSDRGSKSSGVDKLRIELNVPGNNGLNVPKG